jgi:D-sedoheptulose 7-phosphate isomerase
MIASYFNLLSEAATRIDKPKATQAIKVVQDALLGGKLVCTIGNGGSSSTASHFVNDWLKGLSLDRNSRCRAICLSDNTPTLTAIGNDIGFEEVFAFQVSRLMSEGDVLVCVSGSGNSPNILSAVAAAHQLNVTVVAITGFDGGLLLKASDFAFHVPINDMQIVEDLHSTFGHLVLRSSVQ